MILEFIPNHTSNESDWFVKSVARDPCCEDFYVWRDASGFNDSTGEWIPPNDWVRKETAILIRYRSPRLQRHPRDRGKRSL